MSRRAILFVFAIVTLTSLFGCATVRPYISRTSGDGYVLPHQLQQAKRELRRVVETEQQAGRWVELVVSIHCYTNTRIDFCVSLGDFFQSHLRPITFTRVHWDMVPSPSLTGDATDIHWDVVPLIHDQ